MIYIVSINNVSAVFLGVILQPSKSQAQTLFHWISYQLTALDKVIMAYPFHILHFLLHSSSQYTFDQIRSEFATSKLKSNRSCQVEGSEFAVCLFVTIYRCVTAYQHSMKKHNYCPKQISKKWITIFTFSFIFVVYFNIVIGYTRSTMVVVGLSKTKRLMLSQSMCPAIKKHIISVYCTDHSHYSRTFITERLAIWLTCAHLI